MREALKNEATLTRGNTLWDCMLQPLITVVTLQRAYKPLGSTSEDLRSQTRCMFDINPKQHYSLHCFCLDVFCATLFVSLYFWGSNPSSYPHCISTQPFKQMQADNFFVVVVQRMWICVRTKGLYMLLCNQISACGLNCQMNESLVGLMFLVYDS